MKNWMWRWPVFAVVVTGMFWGIWSLFAPVPVVTSIIISPFQTWELPVALSRWWDVPCAGIFALLLAVISLRISQADKQRNRSELVSVLIFGLIFGLSFGLAFGLISGLIFGLSCGLGYGLVFGLSCGLGYGLVFGLIFGLIYGLVHKSKPAAIALFNWLKGY